MKVAMSVGSVVFKNTLGGWIYKGVPARQYRLNNEGLPRVSTINITKMPEQDSKYYDDAFSRKKFRNGANNHYLGDYRDSPFYELWQEIESYIKSRFTVVDIGCGPGQFAEMLADNWSCESYTGIDFSSFAIERAKGRLGKTRNFTFIRNGALAVRYDRLPCDCYILSEVLEHLEDDLELLGKLLPDKRIIITVPSYNDLGHVRYFKSIEQVTKRYEDAINTELIQKIGRHFLIKGTTK